MGKPITFAARWTKDDLNQIKQRAAAQDLSMTEYIRRCALGLHMDDSALDQRLDSLEQRLALVEERNEVEAWR